MNSRRKKYLHPNLLDTNGAVAPRAASWKTALIDTQRKTEDTKCVVLESTLVQCGSSRLQIANRDNYAPIKASTLKLQPRAEGLHTHTGRCALFQHHFLQWVMRRLGA